MGDFQGKVALIVGGSSGIGAATARLLAQQGSSVVVNYRSKISAAQQLVEEIRANGGAALVIQADIQVDQLFGQLRAISQAAPHLYEVVHLIGREIPSAG
jgi:NAD(P)-dependent dehydrogenase (short-subunit alcohol dehydrogenase family)